MIGVSIAPPGPTETGKINNRLCREEGQEEMRRSRIRRGMEKQERRGVKNRLRAGGRTTKKEKEEEGVGGVIKIMEEGRWEVPELHGADRPTTTDGMVSRTPFLARERSLPGV